MGKISYECRPNLLFELGNYKNDFGKMGVPFGYLSVSLKKLLEGVLFFTKEKIVIATS